MVYERQSGMLGITYIGGIVSNLWMDSCRQLCCSTSTSTCFCGTHHTPSLLLLTNTILLIHPSQDEMPSIFQSDDLLPTIKMLAIRYTSTILWQYAVRAPSSYTVSERSTAKLKICQPIFLSEIIMSATNALMLLSRHVLCTAASSRVDNW